MILVYVESLKRPGPAEVAATPARHARQPTLLKYPLAEKHEQLPLDQLTAIYPPPVVREETC